MMRSRPHRLEFALARRLSRPGPLLRKPLRAVRRVVATVLLAATASASAFSGGSPICHTDQIIGCPMGFPVPSGANIFTIELDQNGYTPGRLLTLTIYPSDSFTLINGLLLYVESPDQIGEDSYPIKVGEFVAPVAAGLRHGCSSSSAVNVVTHDGGVDVALPLKVEWMPPDDGPRQLQIRAIVLRAGSEYEWDNAPYAMFNIDLPLDPIFTNSFE